MASVPGWRRWFSRSFATGEATCSIRPLHTSTRRRYPPGHHPPAPPAGTTHRFFFPLPAGATQPWCGIVTRPPHSFFSVSVHFGSLFNFRVGWINPCDSSGIGRDSSASAPPSFVAHFVTLFESAIDPSFCFNDLDGVSPVRRIVSALAVKRIFVSALISVKFPTFQLLVLMLFPARR